MAASDICSTRPIIPQSACVGNPVSVGSGDDKVTLDCVISNGGKCIANPDQIRAYAEKEHLDFWFGLLYWFGFLVLFVSGPIYLIKKLKDKQSSLLAKIKIAMWVIIFGSILLSALPYGWQGASFSRAFLFLLLFLPQPILSGIILFKSKGEEKNVKIITILVLLLELIAVFIWLFAIPFSII